MCRSTRCGAEIEEGFDRRWSCGESVPDEPLAYDEAVVAASVTVSCWDGELDADGDDADAGDGEG